MKYRHGTLSIVSLGIGDNYTGTADLDIEKGSNGNNGHFKWAPGAVSPETRLKWTPGNKRCRFSELFAPGGEPPARNLFKIRKVTRVKFVLCDSRRGILLHPIYLEISFQT